MKMKIEIKLAGLPLRLRLEHAETAAYFEPYTLPDADADVDLYVTAEDFARDGGPLSDAPGAFQEYSLLVAASSRCLLRHGRVVYHGVAVKLGGRAWLITAPSGTGKTTQYKWLKTLYREKVSLICGDKPILERRGENKTKALASGEFLGLLLFVGIPLPGTGGWTGSLAASLMEMKFRKAITAIFLGILMATVIMSIVSYGLLAQIV